MRSTKMNKMNKLNKTRRFSNNRKSNSSSSSSKYSHQHIVSMFLQMLNTVKLYHWKTTSYAQHKATDELYSKLNVWK